MEQEKHSKKIFFKWLIGSGGTALTVFTWEMLEETLENLIALGISSAIAGIALVFATQFLKLSFKKLVKIIFPTIKKAFHRKGNDKVEFIKNHIKKGEEKKMAKKAEKMTKSTVLQKVLTTVLSVFGLGGVVVYFLPQFTPIASQITNLCAMASEIVAVVSGIWLSQTSDKVLTAEEKEAIVKKKEEKQLAKDRAYIEKTEKDAKKLADAKNRVAQATKTN